MVLIFLRSLLISWLAITWLWIFSSFPVPSLPYLSFSGAHGCYTERLIESTYDSFVFNLEKQETNSCVSIIYLECGLYILTQILVYKRFLSPLNQSVKTGYLLVWWIYARILLEKGGPSCCCCFLDLLIW